MRRNMIQAITRCRFTPLVLALVVTGSLWGGTVKHDASIANWHDSSMSTEILLYLNAPLDIYNLVRGKTAQYAVTPYNPDAETSAPTVSDIYSCVLDNNTSIPNLLDCGEISNFLEYEETPLLISGVEPATVYTFYLAFPGVSTLDSTVFYRHIRSAVGEALPPRLVRAQGDSLLLRVSFTGEANYRWFVAEYRESFSLSPANIAALRGEEYIGPTVDGDSTLMVTESGEYDIWIRNLKPLQEYAFWGATFTKTPGVPDTNSHYFPEYGNSYIEPESFSTFLNNSITTTDSSVTVTFQMLPDTNREIALIYAAVHRDQMQYSPENIYYGIHLDDHNHMVRSCSANSSCSFSMRQYGENVQNLTSGMRVDLVATTAIDQEFALEYQGFFSAHAYTRGPRLEAAPALITGSSPVSYGDPVKLHLRPKNREDHFAVRIQEKGKPLPNSNFRSFLNEIDHNSISESSTFPFLESSGDTLHLSTSALEPGRTYQAFVILGSPEGEWQDTLYRAAGEFTIGGSKIPRLTSPVPRVVTTPQVELSFDAPGNFYWSIISVDDYNAEISSPNGRLNSFDGFVSDDNTTEANISSANQRAAIDIEGYTQGDWMLVIWPYVEDNDYGYLTAHHAEFFPLPYVAQIDFQNETAKYPLPPSLAWSNDSSGYKPNQVGQRNQFTIEPRKSYYFFDLENGGRRVSTVLKAPPRPAAPRLSDLRVDNDLQLYKSYIESGENEPYREIVWNRTAVVNQIDSYREAREFHRFIINDHPQELGNNRELDSSFWQYSESSFFLLNRANPLLCARYMAPYDEEIFASDSACVAYDSTQADFAPAMELSGEAGKLRTIVNFDRDTTAVTLVRFYATSSTDTIQWTGAAPQTLFSSIKPGEYSATAFLYARYFWSVSGEEEGKIFVDTLPVYMETFRFTVEDLYHERLETAEGASHWVMFGLGGLTVSGFENSLPGAKELFRWYEDVEWDNEYAKYRTPGELKPGEGGWVWIDRELWISRARPNSATLQKVTVDLITDGDGWNQIANPYPYALSTEQFGERELFAWNRETRDYELRTLLHPFEAVWLQAGDEKSITISPIPYFGAVEKPQKDARDTLNNETPADNPNSALGGASPLYAPPELSFAKASLRLKAGSYSDLNNEIGIGDQKSKQELPAGLAPTISLTSLRDLSGWRSDWRAEGEEIYRWRIALSSGVSGLSRGELEIDESFSNNGWRLWARQNGSLREIKGKSTLEVALPKSGSELELYVAKNRAAVEQQIAQKGWSVRPLWMNAQRAVQFRFQLEAPAELKLHVVDAQGRPVASLHRSFGAGAQSWEWKVPATGEPLYWSIANSDLRAEGVVPQR